MAVVAMAVAATVVAATVVAATAVSMSVGQRRKPNGDPGDNGGGVPVSMVPRWRWC
jgi:hypothetical protein